MISLNRLQKGALAKVVNLPEQSEIKQVLLTHGISPGKIIRLLQNFPSQELSLLTCNGRKIALRQTDLQAIQVQPINE